LELGNMHEHKDSRHKLEPPNIENVVGDLKLLQIEPHCKWATKNRSRSSLVKNLKEEKKALVSTHTEPL
jgi:hypothetical protein